MMKNLPALFLSAVLLLWAAAARADTLELRNGTVLAGKYLGGTADLVRFETSAGLQIVEYSQIKNMSVSPPAAPVPVAAPVALPAAVTLPAGTTIMVQMMDSVSSRSTPGSSFTTKLAYDLGANGVVAVRAGTVVYGKVQSASQAGRLRGKSTLDVRLTQMVPNGSAIPLLTSSYVQAGENEGRKTVAAAGAGAIIGNNANGGGHGGGGAAWGVGLAALKPGQTLTIPPGALVEFTLQQPVTIPLTY